jgi:aspartyl-tRNA(Asn)/glutamyl-tRNA(Gln) amidotransferase subunit A
VSPAHELGVAALARALAARELSSVEVTSHLLDRFAGHERLGTALSIDREGALAQAADADRRRAAGADGPLLGVPIAHKDIFVTRGQPTTAGSRMLAGYRSPFDATVVARLADAGTVTLGKLNCDEFAMGSSTENSAYHLTRNPWDESRVPGGSSGGSAAAVAAGSCRRRPAPTRRLDPPAGELLRHHRHQADLRRLLALRNDRLRVEPGPGRRARAQRGGLRDRLRRDERFDPRDSTSAERPPQDFQPSSPRVAHGARRQAAAGLAHRPARRSSPGGAGRATSTAPCAPRSPRWRARRTLVDVQLPRTDSPIRSTT